MLFTGLLMLMAAVALFSVTPKPRSATITVETRPEGAHLVLGDQFCKASPCTFRAGPGDYHAEASLDNYMKAVTTISVSPGSQTKTIRLIPLIATPEEAKRMGLQETPTTSIKIGR